MNKRIIPLILAPFLLISGCSSIKSYVSDEQVAVVPYDTNCLANMKMGRDYAAQGRYELAREHYLMALAASNDAETRTLVTHELNAVDLMIKTQR